jgi:Nif-specific regulatory protein
MIRPRLSGIQGSLAGKTYEITTYVVNVGRGVSNQLDLKDMAVSRHHCRILRRDSECVLEDLGSTGGTLLNGTPVDRAILKHGDRIQVGYNAFQFLAHEEPDVPSGPVQLADFEDRNVFDQNTIELAAGQSTYFDVERQEKECANRIVRDMNVLLRLSGEISALEGSEQLQNTLLERVFEITPAERAAILIQGALDETFVSEVVKYRLPDSEPFCISRQITKRVLREQKSILSNDALAGASDSIVLSKVRSIVCVPLVVFGEAIGVIYADSRNPSTLFDGRHLELLTAIAGIASIALEHTRYVEWLEAENRELIKRTDLQHEMVGDSAAMQKVYEFIRHVAPTSSFVLIRGETGTGKELAAKAIHQNSPRKSGPFVSLNCAAIPETLFESELFGHVKGAFTSADRDRVGRFQQGDGGTLFLDEVGDLPLGAQAGLLRILEDGEVTPVGTNKSTRVDVRVISATNKNLEAAVKERRFREDLLMRLGMPLELPPLRERTEDIPELVKYLLPIVKRHNQISREVLGATPAAIDLLKQYDWPHNVRELREALNWALIFGATEHIQPQDFPPSITRRNRAVDAGQIANLDGAMAEFEKTMIVKALEKAGGNVVQASVLLGRQENYLQRRITQLHLRSDLERIRKQR